MQLLEFSKWIKEKTLLRIITVEKGKGHQVYVGNLLFADDDGNNFLFYDLDHKKNYNLSINQIEDIQPYDGKNKKTTESPVQKLIASKIAANQTLANKDTNTDQVINKVNIESFKKDIREEVINLIKELPSNELYALVPLLQLLANKKNCKL